MPGPPTSYSINVASPQYAGLIALWPTQNEVIGTLEDQVGSFDGTLDSGVTWQSDSEMGGCLDCDGTNDGIVPVDDIGALSYPCEFEVWVKTTDDSSDMIAFGRGNSGTGTPLIQIGCYLGTPSAALRDNSGTIQGIDAGPDIADGAWHLLSFVLRASDDREFYVDGVSVGTATDALGATTLNTTTIGGRINTGVIAPWNGQIAHPRIRVGTIQDDATRLAAFTEATRWDLYFDTTPRPLRASGVGDFDLSDPVDRTNPDTSGLEFFVMPKLGAGMGLVDRIRHLKPENYGTKAALEPDSEMGSILRFDGDGHEIYPFNWVNLGRSYSVMSWFRLDEELIWNPLDTSQQIAVLVSMPDVGLIAYANETGPATVYTVLTDSVDNSTFGDVPVIAGQWYVVTTVFHADGTVDFALDGAIVDSGPITGHTMAGGPLRIGSSTDSIEAAPFAQHPISIGGTAVWSRALSPAEIKRLAEADGWTNMLNAAKRTRRYTQATSTSIVQPVQKVQKAWDVPGPVAVW